MSGGEVLLRAWGVGLRIVGSARPAAGCDDGLGQPAGKAKLTGSIDNLRRSMAVDKRLRNDSTRTKITSLALGHSGHEFSIPFCKRNVSVK